MTRPVFANGLQRREKPPTRPPPPSAAPPPALDVMQLLDDAEGFAGLTEWESNFLDDLRGRMLISKGAYQVSEKQFAVLRRIEGKVRPQ